MTLEQWLAADSRRRAQYNYLDYPAGHPLSDRVAVEAAGSRASGLHELDDYCVTDDNGGCVFVLRPREDDCGGAGIEQRPAATSPHQHRNTPMPHPPGHYAALAALAERRGDYASAATLYRLAAERSETDRYRQYWSEAVEWCE
jgi:hypothetical protein